jgi:hypothetical protein
MQLIEHFGLGLDRPDLPELGALAGATSLETAAGSGLALFGSLEAIRKIVRKAPEWPLREAARRQRAWCRAGFTSVDARGGAQAFTQGSCVPLVTKLVHTWPYLDVP